MQHLGKIIDLRRGLIIEHRSINNLRAQLIKDKRARLNRNEAER
jgi:hypothetical protein